RRTIFSSGAFLNSAGFAATRRSAEAAATVRGSGAVRAAAPVAGTDNATARPTDSAAAPNAVWCLTGGAPSTFREGRGTWRSLWERSAGPPLVRRGVRWGTHPDELSAVPPLLSTESIIPVRIGYSIRGGL